MLTEEQIRLREYLQECVDEVRSKKYINTLIEELNYLLIHVNDIALDLARGRKFRDVHKDFLVGITTSKNETRIVLQGIFGDKILPVKPQMFKSHNHNPKYYCPKCTAKIRRYDFCCAKCGQRLDWWI